MLEAVVEDDDGRAETVHKAVVSDDRGLGAGRACCRRKSNEGSTRRVDQLTNTYASASRGTPFATATEVRALGRGLTGSVITPSFGGTAATKRTTKHDRNLSGPRTDHEWCGVTIKNNHISGPTTFTRIVGSGTGQAASGPRAVSGVACEEAHVEQRTAPKQRSDRGRQRAEPTEGKRANPTARASGQTKRVEELSMGLKMRAHESKTRSCRF